MTNQEKLEKQLNEVIKSNRKKLVEMNATEYELTAYDLSKLLLVALNEGH